MHMSAACLPRRLPRAATCPPPAQAQHAAGPRPHWQLHYTLVGITHPACHGLKGASVPCKALATTGKEVRRALLQAPRPGRQHAGHPVCPARTRIIIRDVMGPVAGRRSVGYAGSVRGAGRCVQPCSVCALVAKVARLVSYRRRAGAVSGSCIQPSCGQSAWCTVMLVMLMQGPVPVRGKQLLPAAEST